MYQVYDYLDVLIICPTISNHSAAATLTVRLKLHCLYLSFHQRALKHARHDLFILLMQWACLVTP